MKVLVFGSRGFLGRSVTQCAKKMGIVVDEASSLLGNGLDPKTGLLHAGFNISPGTNAVIYLSQSPHSNKGAEGVSHAFAVNTFAPLQVAQFAVDAGAARFIYVSTGTVYGPSFSPLKESSPLRRDSLYALSKVHGEEGLSLLRNRLDLTVVRPFSVYGPGQIKRLVPKLAESIREGRKLTLRPRIAGPTDLEDGGLRISLCHVEDAAEALLSFCTHDSPPVVNLASAEALSIREIAGCLGEELGKNPEFEIDAEIRPYDLIADTSLLSKCCPVRFRPFRQGVRGLFC